MNPEQVPPHYHRDGTISEADVVPDGRTFDVVPDWAAPEGTEVSYLNAGDFRRYRMADGEWRAIGGSGSFSDLFSRFIHQVGWDSKDSFIETIVLGGGAATAYSSHLLLQCASGVGGNEFWIEQGAEYFSIFEAGKRLTVEWVVPDLSNSGGQQDFFLYMGQGSVPVTVQHHFGFDIRNNVIRCSTGDGTAEAQTDTALPILGLTNHMYRLRAVATRGTDVKFYVDDALVATHATNLPDVDDMKVLMGVKSGNAGAEQIFVNRVLVERQY